MEKTLNTIINDNHYNHPDFDYNRQVETRKRFQQFVWNSQLFLAISSWYNLPIKDKFGLGKFF